RLEEAGVPIREETIARFDRVRVRLLDALEAGERRHEHEERRARQVEVREEKVDRLEPVARRDEEPRLAGERANPAALVGRALEEAERGGAYRDDAAPGRARGAEPLSRRFVEKSGLGVHDVLLGVLDLDREESAGADMKRERQPFDPARRERLEQR